jgi:hypothetical protein
MIRLKSTSVCSTGDNFCFKMSLLFQSNSLSYKCHTCKDNFISLMDTNYVIDINLMKSNNLMTNPFDYSNAVVCIDTTGKVI